MPFLQAVSAQGKCHKSCVLLLPRDRVRSQVPSRCRVFFGPNDQTQHLVGHFALCEAFQALAKLVSSCFCLMACFSSCLFLYSALRWPPSSARHPVASLPGQFRRGRPKNARPQPAQRASLSKRSTAHLYSLCSSRSGAHRDSRHA